MSAVEDCRGALIGSLEKVAAASLQGQKAHGASRNLIVLSDGTGNSSAKAFKTNVWRLYQALDLTDGNQVAVFGDGVGTSSIKFWRVLGLALGVGVKRNVLSLYKFLCRNYNEGDRIWAFGFSRGAFTIRVLVGLIHREGLVAYRTEDELNRNALAAYRAYRNGAFHTAIPWVISFRYSRDRLISFWNRLTGARLYKDVKEETFKKNRHIIDIYFVGVWDTVVAYGLPIDELTQAVDKWVWPMRFRDASLLPNVENARHALSLDDERRTFFPIPWDETAEKQLPRQLTNADRLRQVWFPGAHADVGGGYPDDGLSYVALCWMIEEAAKLGLRFEPNLVESYTAIATPTGRIYDSRSGFGAFWRYQPRDVQMLMGEGNTPLVHNSVITRMAYGNDGYAPISLPGKIDVLPPSGPPVGFDALSVVRALADTEPSCNQSQSDSKRLLLQKQRRFLMDMQKSVSAANGKARAYRFALVLDTVWWRRVVYFGSLFLVLLAAAYPLLRQYLGFQGVTDGLDAAAGGPAGWAIGLVRGSLPGFAEPWLAAISDKPAEAVLIIVALFASLRFSGFLQRRIYDRARAAWNSGGHVGAITVDRLALTGQRRALTLGMVVFAALAVGVKVFGDGNHFWLLTFFALLSFACLGYRLYRMRFPSQPMNPAHPGLLLGLARKARQSPRAVKYYRFTARTVAPAVFLVSCAIIAASMVHRAAFDLLSTAGAYCRSAETTHETRETQDEKLSTNRPTVVRTDQMCNPTGLTLVAGRKYRIRLEMSEDWFDKSVHTDVRGFAADGIRHYLASPLKRWWRENWFQPIARIGELGNYEHVLQAAAPLPVVRFTNCSTTEEKHLSAWDAIKDIPNPASKELRRTELACETQRGVQRSNELISDITADATGELFIYVNDAILMWPGLTDLFYRNNSGTATVTATRILAPQIIDAPGDMDETANLQRVDR
jgi:uncharacterized protein (DUF2235 family)